MRNCMVSHFNITLTSLAYRRAAVFCLFVFLLSTSWYGVYEVEFCHIGKTAEASILGARIDILPPRTSNHTHTKTGKL